jgi:hypothetical protein
MAMLREDATAEERKLRPPVATDDADISVRVHRTLFTTALEDPQLLEMLSPLFKKLLEARSAKVKKGQAIPRISEVDIALSEPKWSFDLEWISVDFSDGERVGANKLAVD